MDNINEHVAKISIETSEIKIADIQNLLKVMENIRRTSGCSDQYEKCCQNILNILWKHLEKGLPEFDDQLLCSTCFYAMLLHSKKKQYYLKKVVELLNKELYLKKTGVEVSCSMTSTISLTYGIFQSLLLQQKSEESTLAVVLEKTFALVTLMAYDYSQYTFITFKIMTFFKKVVGTAHQNIIFNEDHNFKLLNIINHNWENPLSGVRSLNKIIFHNLISVLDECMHELIEKKLNSFCWNKAKYLMLAEIIELSQSNIKALIDKYNLVEGLEYSLKKPGLVSAGADMYVTILKKLNTEEEWCTTFLVSIIKIVKGLALKPVENYNNYWCLNTLKKFPVLSQIIFDEVNNLDSAEHKLYILLCITQQSNRLGLLEKYFTNCNIEELVTNNIDHNDVHIRMTAFNILCGLHNKFFPDQKEYNLVLDFLKNNVNSDCSVLRINMIKSFQNFLVQLHMAFVNNGNIKDCDIINLTTFCKELQIFLLESLEFDGNYQRKVSTIQIIKTLLATFKEIPRKKQKGTRQLQTTLFDFIKSRNEWLLSEKEVIFKLISLLKDPSDDIRASVKDVLLSNYSEQLSRTEIITHLTDEALSCTRSRFFYQIACGQTIFKLILNILLIENCTEGMFKCVEDVFNFAYNEIKTECDSNPDIVKSIIEGKQLHSYLNILHSIFEVSLENSYELNIPDHMICTLIELLKATSNQFAWEQENSVSSDFSKMSDMVEEMITRSEYKICHQYNETNISGLHQIVLNCLWLNVKASCELSSILIRYYKHDNFEKICDECLKLICNVLETSRHKGAIEAGGAALGQAIQQLTSLPPTSLISKIPMLLLKRKFKQLVLETSNMNSVTRRGAGLSIMIHRIVSSDMKKGKPLFHYFMQTLLETCDKLFESSGEIDISNEKDLPQAIYIHFLTKIVVDSSLASDMMYYSGQLAKLAFDNLSSPSWQIRNAALQLYGSLIPKLIGQKKNSGASEEVIATVAVDEFRTHSPKLWIYIETQIKESTESHCDVVQCHNNLVPILSILANLAPFYSFNNEMESKQNIFPSLSFLLGSPIYVVRRLASKCILNLYPLNVILDILLKHSCVSENSLHGTLVLLNECTKQYNTRDMKETANLLRNRYTRYTDKKCSYLSRERFENTFAECTSLTEEMVKETLSEICDNRNAQGIYLWANFRIQLCLEHMSWDLIPKIVTLISEHCDFEKYCETLHKRLEGEKIIDDNILLELSSSLYSLGFRRNSSIIWRTLYQISLHLQSINSHLDTSLLHRYLQDYGVSYRTRYMIAFAVRILNENEELLYLSQIIFNLCHPETNVDIRLIATVANNELAGKFESLTDCIKINSIKAAAIFLQDEDEDVRNVSVHFYRKVNMDERSTHPYICWRKMLNKTFLHKVLNNPHPGIESICKGLFDVLKSLNINNEDEYNPFANESKNIYLETEVFKVVLRKLIST